ncbi:hypothetical protein K9L63_03145 [Candidatus Gracilibacteria bacterium]|nr:hypothetical protein [Candidatus Gracilibacteria bacterium]
MKKEIYIFCPDCRGKFEVERTDITEGEILECSLCGAEIEVLQEQPIKIRLLSEDNEGGGNEQWSVINDQKIYFSSSRRESRVRGMTVTRGRVTGRKKEDPSIVSHTRNSSGGQGKRGKYFDEKGPSFCLPSAEPWPRPTGQAGQGVPPRWGEESSL